MSKTTVFAGSVIIAVATAAHASFPAGVFEVTASNSKGTATYTRAFNAGNVSGDLFQVVDFTGQSLLDGDNDLIATIPNFVITYEDDADPRIGVSWAVNAVDDIIDDTTFEIRAGIFNFDAAPINPAIGSASASIGGVAGSDGTFALNGAGSRGHAFEAFYNSTSTIEDGVIFAPFFLSEINESNPGDSDGLLNTPVVGDVNNMGLRFIFTLSPDDQANGTAAYTFVPAPSTAAIAPLLGLAAVRRRRR